MIRNTGTAFLILICACVTFFSCTPVSNNGDSDHEATLLRLSLEQMGRFSAEFSGAPIEATVELDHDTLFDVLNWQTGKGDLIYPDTVFGVTAKKFTVRLFWTEYPSYKDTADGMYCDTIWVSMGGGMKKSNIVMVKVTNLPVVIDSARFDSLLFQGHDTVWYCALPPVLMPSYQVKVYAHDYDLTTPEIQFVGKWGKFVRNDNVSAGMIYQPTGNDFIDTVSIVAYDQMRGQDIRRLIISHVVPNVAPSIDSIRINDVTLGSASFVGNIYRAGFILFDTLKMRLYAHDSTGEISSVRWEAVTDRLFSDSADQMLATYICTESSCSDTLNDSSYVIDTITITVTDSKNQSTVRRIELSKGRINMPPQISNLSFNGFFVEFVDTVATVETSGGGTYPLALYASDPDSQELVVIWTGSPAGCLTDKTDSTAQYHAPMVRDTDIVRVTVSDNIYTIKRTLNIVINDILPIIDSIIVGDTVLKGSKEIFSVGVSSRDTLTLQAFLRDLDLDDSISCQWTSSKPERFLVTMANRARYAVSSNYPADTVVLTVQDGEAKTERRIVFLPENNNPCIDSIRSNERMLVKSGEFYLDTADISDTIVYRVFVTDPDGDNYFVSWSGTDPDRFTQLSGDATKYICKNSAFVDTLRVTASDERGADTDQRIILQVLEEIEP